MKTAYSRLNVFKLRQAMGLVDAAISPLHISHRSIRQLPRFVRSYWAPNSRRPRKDTSTEKTTFRQKMIDLRAISGKLKGATLSSVVQAQ